MHNRGTDQRVAAAMESNPLVRRLVRRLSRREGAALTLPLTLALLGTSIARERSGHEETSQEDRRAGGEGVATIANAGDKLAIYSQDAVLAEHLLTEADAAAGEVRLALRMIRSANGFVKLENVSADAASGTADPEAEQLAADAEEAAEASADAEGASGEGGTAAAAGDNANAGGTAASAAQDDDDDRGLLWVVVGLGAAGAGIAIASSGSSDKDDEPPVVVDPPPPPPPPPPAGLSGQVVKGYVHGAAVYLDTNNDGLPDGDPVYTDADGRFTFESAPDGASLIVYGGVDTLTNVPLDGTILRAPAGATVVTPLTTLIDEMMRLDSSLTASEAQSKLVSALGLTLPAGANLLTYDSVAGNGNGGASIEDASEAVLNTIGSIQSLLVASGALGAIDAAGATITALAQTLMNGSGSVNLASAADLQQVLETALNANDVGASDASDMASLASAIASVNGALVEASGLGDEALQATRYALSSFQDLLAKIGANAHGTEQYARDISFSSNETLADAVGQIVGGNVDTIIGEHAAANISYAERLEGQRFVFALNPELKLYQGAPDRIDVATVKFDEPGVLVQRESRGADGQIVTEVLTPDENGRYTLRYEELDKIYIQPPQDFNGTLGADVTAHYVGLDVIDTPDTLGIEITAVNDAPASADATVSGTEDKTYVFSLADFPFSDAADAAYAGGANALAAVKIGSLPAQGSLFLNGVELTESDIEAGILVSAADIAQGLLTFVPPANASGASLAHFSFQVQDDGGTAHGGTALSTGSYVMTLDLSAVNDAPVAEAAAGSIVEDGRYTFSASDFRYTDVEGHALESLIVRSLPVNGVLYLGENAIGSDELGEEGFAVSFEDIMAGRLVFVPNDDFHGTETFDFALRDAGGTPGDDTSNQVSFTLTVPSVSDAPVAQDSSVSIEEDETHVFAMKDFSVTDVDGDNLVNLIITSLPTGGTLYFGEDRLSGEDLGAAGYAVSVEDLQNGLLKFVPDADFNGSVSFGYRVQDDGGTESGGKDLSDPATLNLTINAVTDAPVAGDNSVTIDEDGSHVFSASDFSFTDADGDALAKVLITSLPINGTLYLDGQAIHGEDLGEDGYSVSADDLQNGLLTFVPDADFNGPVQLEYRIQDTGSDDANLSDPATLNLTVNAVSDAPESGDGAVDMEEDGLHVFSASDFSFQDADGDNLASLIITSLPTGGALYYGEHRLTGEDLGETGYVVPLEHLEAGGLVFVPDADFNGSVSFGYQVKDDSGADGADTSAPATMTVNIAAVSDAPVANDATVDSNEDKSRTLRAADFSYTDADNDELAALIIRSLPDNGALRFDGVTITSDDLAEGFRITAAELEAGKLVFVPAEDYNGSVSFTYQVQDDSDASADTSDVATLTINVKAVNDAPVLSLPDYPCELSPQPMGESNRVNTYTDGNQEHPSITALADGGYVIVWISRGQDGDGYGIYGQRYGADGQKAGEEFQVNTTTANDQFDPQVVAGPEGSFAVMWSSATEQTGNNITASGIVLRTFWPTGEAEPEVALPVSQSGLQIEPTLAVGPCGALAAWTSDGANGFDIRGWLALAGGESTEFVINTTTAFDQSQPAVIALADGTYVVSWTGRDGEDDSKGVFARRIGADGEMLGEEFRVNVGTEGDQTQSSMVALANGGFVVAWTGVDTSLTGVYVQRYDAGGEPVGKAVLVNTSETNDQRDPALAALPDGGFVVTWTSWGTTDSTLDIYAQRFGSDGLQLGEPVLVNTVTVYEQTTPDIAVLADGSVVVTWQSNNEDGSGYSIHAQRFEPMAPNFIEGGDPVVIAPAAKVSDVELDALNEGQGDWSGASLVIQREEEGYGRGRDHGHWESPDHFGFKDGDGYWLRDDGTLLKGDQAFAHFSVEQGRLVVTFATYEGAPAPTTADVNYVLQHITYWNSSDDPGESVKLSYRVEDGNAESNGEQGNGGEGKDCGTVTVQITPVNDAPEPHDNTVRMFEDHSHTFEAQDFCFRDAEGDDLESIVITSLPEHGTLYFGEDMLSGEDLGEDGFVVTAEDLSSGKLVFRPDENFNGSVSFGYRVQDDGGTARNGEDTSGEATMSLVVKPVNDAPELVLSSARVLIVNTTADEVNDTDGVLSLREALAQAQAGDVIRFDESLSGNPIMVSEKLRISTAGIYIDGSTVENLLLSYQGYETLFDIEAGAGLILSGVSLHGGGEGYAAVGLGGVAISNAGTLILHDLTIEGFNRGIDGGIGATVLYNKEGGTVYASQVTFSGNIASGGTDASGEGTHVSLVYNEGTFWADQVVFSDNSVQGGHGSFFGGNAHLLQSTSLGSGDVSAVDNTILGGNGGEMHGSAGEYSMYLPGDAGFTFKLPEIGGGSVTYTEGGEDGVLLAAGAQVADVDLDAMNGGLGDWSGASITIGRKEDGEDYHGYGWGHWTSDDQYGFVDGNDLTFVNGEIVKTVEGVQSVIGRYFTSHSGELKITFSTAEGEGSAIPTTADVNHVLQQVTYRNTSDDPEESITLTFRVEDGNAYWRGEQGWGGKLSATGELVVNITPVNDAPVARYNSLHLVEDHSHTFEVSDFRFRDAERDSLKAVTIKSLPENGTLYFNGVAVSAEQILSGFTVTREDLECGRLTFEPAEDFHGSISFGYTLQDDGGTEHSGADTSAEATFRINVYPVNDAPELNLVSSNPYGSLSYQSFIADSAETDGLRQARSVSVSPDGKQVFVTGVGDNSLTVFSRDAETGALTYVTRFQDGVNDVDGLSAPYGVTFSQDGSFVYVAGSGDNAIAIFSRNTETGELTYQSNVTGVSGARELVISDDGLFAYAVAFDGNSLVCFSRNPVTGALNYQSMITDGVDGFDGLKGARDLVISGDGRNVYVASFGEDAIAILNRDPVTGQLSYFGSLKNNDLGGTQGIADASSLVISADGKYIYVAGNEDSAIAVFSRDADTGWLSYVTVLRDGIDGVDGLGGVRTLVLAPDGLTLYATSNTDDSVAIFSRDPQTGALSFQGYIQDGEGTNGLDGAFGIAISPDGKNVYVASDKDNSVAVLGRETHETPRYVENGEAVLISPKAHVSDAELDARNDGQGDWSGASITIQRESEGDDYSKGYQDGSPDDQFGFRDGNGLTFVDGEIRKTVDDVTSVIGHYSVNSGKLVITFSTQEGVGSAIPTSEDVNNVLRQATYSNASDDPEESVTLQYRVEDGNARWHGSQGWGGEGCVIGEITVDIVQVNDAPVIETAPIVTLNEDHGYTFSKSDFGFADKEDDGLDSVIIHSLPANGTLYFNDAPVTLEQVSCGFSVSAEDLSCGRLTFEPSEHYYGSTSFTYQVKDDGGTSNGGQDTSALTTFTFDMRSVNDAPELELPAASGYTFTVTTLEDSVDDTDGVLSLREALALAQDGDSITFDASLLGGMIDLAETLTITKQVYINGAPGGGPGITLEVGNFTAVVVSEAVGNTAGGAILQGLTIMGNIEDTLFLGEGTAVKGLYNRGTLTLADVQFSNMFLQSSAGVDAITAIYNGAGGYLAVSNVSIAGNSAIGGLGYSPLMPAGNSFIVRNDGEMHAVGLSLTDNTVVGGHSDAIMDDLNGGAAYVFYNGSVLYGDIDAALNSVTGGSPTGEGMAGTAQVQGGNESLGDTAWSYTPPELSGGGDKGPSVDYATGGEAVLLAPEATVADVELDKLNGGQGNWSGATITLQRQGGANADDVFGHVSFVGFLPPALVWNDENGTILKNGEVIATFSSSQGVLSIHFTGYGSAIPTTSDVNEILRQLTYSNTSMDPEEQLTVEYTIADGNLSFHGTQGSGGEGVTVGTVQVNITPLTLGQPLVTLDSETDTASLGDGITSEAVPQLHVTLPDNAYVGSVVKLFADGGSEPFATHTLTEEDLTARSVLIDAPADTSAAITAQLVGANGNTASPVSPAFFLVSDSSAPVAPVLDEESLTLRVDHVNACVISGSAEAFSTVTVQLTSEVDGEPAVYHTTADGDGRFTVLVDATGFVSENVNTVSIAASATDRAGNTSTMASATLTVTAATPPAVVTMGGTEIDDVWAPTATPQEGVQQAVTFIAGANGGQDYFLAPPETASKLVIDGNSADYVITRVDEASYELHNTLLTGRNASLYEDAPFYQISRWTSEGSIVWVQADAVEFNDGVVRLTADGVVGGSLSGGTQVIHGGSGDERISGGAGDDVLFGFDRNDVLLGNDGNDTLVSIGGKDTLIGGAGEDTLVVFGDNASGDDSTADLYGGEGSDVFVIAPRSGFARDVTIHDFVIGEDKLDLSWLRMPEGSGVRELVGEDLNFDGLAALLQEDGSLSIDLGEFVTDSGSAIEGTLTLRLAGGSSAPSLDDVILDPVEGTPVDMLLWQAQHQAI